MKRETLALIVILLIAFLLRSYGISRVFNSNDSIEIAYHSSCHKGSVSDWIESLKPTRTHSILGLIYGVLLVKVFGLLGLSITEFVWNMPFAIIGTLTVLMAYILVKKLFGRDFPALSASLFLAVFPHHIVLSHTSGHVHHTLALLLEFTVLLSFIHYYSRPSGFRLFTASVISAFAILSHQFFPLVYITVLFLCAHFTRGESIDRLSDSIKILFKKYLSQPVTIVIIFITSLISLVFASYHSGASYGLLPGIHIRHFLLNTLFYMDLIPAFVGVLCLVYSLKYLVGFRLEGVPTVLFISYSLPFLFVFDRCITNFFILPAVAFILMTGAILGELVSSKKFGNISLILIFLITMILLSMSLEDLGVLEIPSFIKPGEAISCGSLSWDCIIPCTRDRDDGIYPDSGVKAAAYWIRENTPQTALVFSDATDGAGIEANIIGYYIHRPYVCLNDANITRILDLFEESRPDLDILIIRPVNMDIFEDLIVEEFKRVAVITSNSEDILFLYSRGESGGKTPILDLSVYNRLYDLKYAEVGMVTDCNLDHLIQHRII